MFNKYIVLFIIFFFITVGLQSQTSINTSGGSAKGNGGSVNYSIGQIMYKTYFNKENSVIDGVQQPFEISEITSIFENSKMKLTLSAYPNPTEKNITLDIEDKVVPNLYYQIYGIKGELIRTNKITTSKTTIEMGEILAGTYFFRVMQENKIVKSFKVVKTF